MLEAKLGFLVLKLSTWAKNNHWVILVSLIGLQGLTGKIIAEGWFGPELYVSAARFHELNGYAIVGATILMAGVKLVLFLQKRGLLIKRPVDES